MKVCLSPNGRNVFAGEALPSELLVGTIDGISVLERQGPGNSWKKSGHQLKDRHISALLLEPKRGGLFAGVHGKGLYASMDGGKNWELKTRRLTQEHVYTLASVERNGDIVLYAGTEPAHLFQSVDYGETWQELSALRSVPGSDKWTFPAPPRLGHVKHIAFDPRDSRVMFASIEQGALLKSMDAGKSWHEISSFYKPEDEVYKDVHRLVLRPSNPDQIYFTGGMGLYGSSNGGQTWEHLTLRSWRIGYPDALFTSPVDDTVMFMAGASKAPQHWRETKTAGATVARSRDGGRMWEILEGFPQSLRGNIEAMSMAVWANKFALFAGTTDGEVLLSEDEGESWSQIASGLAPVSKAGHYRQLQ